MEKGLLARSDLEAHENAWLAPYACRAAASQGRVYAEDLSPNRTCFQQDRDRIIHSRAFRRLKHKTQVFVSVEGDHYRTRLTHTLEVAQIARHLARLLRLNEDLCECIALAHDLGHPPFGHAGEAVLGLKMKDHGGFEHNMQSKRIVEVLESRYPDYPGLNLSFELRHGLLKHGPGRSDHPQSEPQPQISLEAQLVDLADEIAYTNHDFDDGLAAGILKLSDLKNIELWQLAEAEVRRLHTEIETVSLIHLTIGTMIKLLVDDVAKATYASIQTQRVCNIKDVYAAPVLAQFSDAMLPRFKACKKYLLANFYQHPQVIEKVEERQAWLASIFDYYLKAPPTEIAAQTSKHRGICDYVAGMTDTFAETCYRKLSQ